MSDNVIQLDERAANILRIVARVTGKGPVDPTRPVREIWQMLSEILEYDASYFDDEGAVWVRLTGPLPTGLLEQLKTHKAQISNENFVGTVAFEAEVLRDVWREPAADRIAARMETYLDQIWAVAPALTFCDKVGCTSPVCTGKGPHTCKQGDYRCAECLRQGEIAIGFLHDVLAYAEAQHRALFGPDDICGTDEESA